MLVDTSILSSDLKRVCLRYVCSDLKVFYLGTPMSRYEYMQILIWPLPKEIMDKYDFHALVRNRYVLCEIRRGMYSLPQASIISYK